MDKDDTVTVTFGHYQTFRFSAACCVPAPGASVDTVGAVGAEVGARRAVGAVGEVGAAAGLKPGSTSGCSDGGGGDGGDVPVYRNDPDDDDVSREKQNSDSDSDNGKFLFIYLFTHLLIHSGSILLQKQLP